MPRTVAEHLADLRYVGRFEGAERLGEACGDERLKVQVGLWWDSDQGAVRARYRATTCAALIAYAEAACALAERWGPQAVTAARLREAVRGVHPAHRDRAGLVALAFARALALAPVKGSA
ncbi:MAG TPA: hypothetical protein VMG32_08235 [Anaeromyxobacteraceae bacterium]|nr:hypothetical protein [Anaeromyxobacteraceae bacterium]